MKSDKASARNVTKSLLRDYAAKRLVFQAMPGHRAPPRSGGDVTPDVTNQGPDVTTEEAEFLADPLDPRAAFSAARAERWLADIVSDREAGRVWTVNEVKWRLEEAARIGERVIRKDGPSQKTGFWPDPDFFGDISDFDRNTWFEGLRDGTREPDPIMRSVAASASEVEISRFEQAIFWPMHYLGEDRFGAERATLQGWMKALAYRQPWRRWMVEPEGASRWRRGNAFMIITCGLIRDNARMV